MRVAWHCDEVGHFDARGAGGMLLAEPERGPGAPKRMLAGKPVSATKSLARWGVPMLTQSSLAPLRSSTGRASRRSWIAASLRRCDI